LAPGLSQPVTKRQFHFITSDSLKPLLEKESSFCLASSPGLYVLVYGRQPLDKSEAGVDVMITFFAIFDNFCDFRQFFAIFDNFLRKNWRSSQKTHFTYAQKFSCTCNLALFFE
jgi:hypothetical protein